MYSIIQYVFTETLNHLQPVQAEGVLGHRSMSIASGVEIILYIHVPSSPGTGLLCMYSTPAYSTPISDLIHSIFLYLGLNLRMLGDLRKTGKMSSTWNVSKKKQLLGEYDQWGDHEEKMHFYTRPLLLDTSDLFFPFVNFLKGWYSALLAMIS
jgi:hypothetical protein